MDENDPKGKVPTLYVMFIVEFFLPSSVAMASVWFCENPALSPALYPKAPPPLHPESVMKCFECANDTYADPSTSVSEKLLSAIDLSTAVCVSYTLTYESSVTTNRGIRRDTYKG